MSTGNRNVTGPGPDPVVDSAWGCGWAWLWFWLFIIVIIFAGWGWGGWYGGWGGPRGWWGPRQATPPQTTAPQTNEPRQSSLPPATTASGEFLGRTVTVSGQVEQVLAPNVFTLSGASGGRQLLVVSKNRTAQNVKKGEKVQVTGTVEKYDANEFHQQTNVDLNKVPAADFVGRPAVLASSVSTGSTPS